MVCNIKPGLEAQNESRRLAMKHHTKESARMTIGLDLGDKHSHLRVLNSEGDIIEEGRIRTTPEDFKRRFKGIEPALVALEAGTHSPWAYRVIRECGHEVIVANPRQVPLISQNNQKSDDNDPELLGRLARMDRKLLKPIQPRGLKEQIALAELRARDCLVKARTKLINHVRGVVKSHGGRTTGVSVDCFHAEAEERIPTEIRETLRPVLKMIGELTAQIGRYQKKIENLCKKEYPQTEVLQQISGVGALTSLAFMLVLGDPKRFEESRDVGPYLGLAPGKDDSGEHKSELRITKAGDGFMRRLLVCSAHYILGPFGPDTDLRRHGEKIAQTGKKKAKKRAVVAVARKLAVLLHRLWTTGEEYEPLRNTIRKQKRIAKCKS
jgi:transposase